MIGSLSREEFSPQKCTLMLKKKGRCRMRAFQQNWTAKYLFTEVGGKAVCVVCGEQMAKFKDYGLNQH